MTSKDNGIVGRSPVDLLMLVNERHSWVKEYELGIYRYVPQTTLDSRRTVRVKASQFRETASLIERALNPGEEVAVHSSLLVHSKLVTEPKWHLPMVDLVGRPDATRINALGRLAYSFGCEVAALVDSGRSFHFYGLNPISQGDWMPFMSRLLLLNSPGTTDCVDARWVGHRLLAGYGSLRLTWNSPHYVAAPTVVKVFKTDGDIGVTQDLIQQSTPPGPLERVLHRHA